MKYAILTRFSLALAIWLAVPNVLAATLHTKTLSSDDENVVFSCSIRSGGKKVSLCASKDLNSDTGYMQYRFGRDTSSLQLQYPATKVHPKGIFKFDNVGISHGGMNAFSFHNEKYRYSIFDTKTPIGSSSGVIIDRDGKRVAFLKCDEETPIADNTVFIYPAGLQNAGQDIEVVGPEDIMTGRYAKKNNAQ